MLRVFFFVFSFITDYPLVAEIVRGSSTLGLANAAVLSFVGGCAAIRGWLVKRNRIASQANGE